MNHNNAKANANLYLLGLLVILVIAAWVGFFMYNWLIAWNELKSYLVGIITVTIGLLILKPNIQSPIQGFWRAMLLLSIMIISISVFDFFYRVPQGWPVQVVIKQIFLRALLTTVECFVTFTGIHLIGNYLRERNKNN